MNALVTASAMNIDAQVYINSAPLDGSWGQPPASYYRLTVVDNVMQGQLISGVYQTLSSGMSGPHEGRIRPEVLQAIDATLQEGSEVWKELAKR